MTAIARMPELTSRARGTYRDDHGTPAWVLGLHREIHGPGIDIDLASSDEANEIVMARKFFSAARPCPEYPSSTAVMGRAVWCNPPGPGAEVKRFWNIWRRCVDGGAEGSFLAFSVDHMRGFEPPPIECWVGLFTKRLRFQGNTSGASFPSAIISTRPPRTPGARAACVWMAWDTGK